MARKKIKKPETDREKVIDAVEFLNRTPNGFVRFTSDTKKEHKELEKIVGELVPEELLCRLQLVCC